jgi:hypothetical protein
MDVKIKEFSIEMEVKNSGIEFEIKSNAGEHLGDLIITKTRLIWCQGRVRRENGKTIELEELIQMMQTRP